MVLISARLMKEVAVEIASPLTYIFNKSLQDGCVPHMWKCFNVTPVHKGDSVDDPSNYQSISAVSVAAKVLEKLMATYLFSQVYIQDAGIESLVLSRMRYAISTWGPALQQRYISYLQQMQNRGVQLSCNLKEYDHVSSHCLGLRWLSVQDQIKQLTLSCMYGQCHYQS